MKTSHIYFGEFFIIIFKKIFFFLYLFLIWSPIKNSLYLQNWNTRRKKTVKKNIWNFIFLEIQQFFNVK